MGVGRKKKLNLRGKNMMDYKELYESTTNEVKELIYNTLGRIL
jgi:hypothetical protein